MLKTLGAMILRGFCDVGIGLARLVLLVGAVLGLTWTVGLLTYATMTVELPNGATPPASGRGRRRSRAPTARTAPRRRAAVDTVRISRS